MSGKVPRSAHLETRWNDPTPWSRIENSCLEPLSLVFPRRVEPHVLVEVASTSRQDHKRTMKTRANLDVKTLDVEHEGLRSRENV
jgi:hypothetical protein